jgi:hypothetical protein
MLYMDNELENIQVDMEIQKIQKSDDNYLRNHPDPFATVNFRTAQIRCPICKCLMPYMGCALHFNIHKADFGLTQAQVCRLIRDAPNFLIG